MLERTQWEYSRIVEEVANDADLQGAVDERMLDLITTSGLQGWELISSQPATRFIPNSFGKAKPVIVLLFKRPKVADH